MFTWKRLFLAGGISLLVALAFTMLILPGIVSERASRWVAEETGRVLEIESISINPFSLTAELRKLKLSDIDQTGPFVSWDLLRISLSLASLYHQAPVIDELRLDRPNIYLEKLATGHFNFSDLIPEQSESPGSEPATESTQFSINNLAISDGQIDFIDNSLPEQLHHTVRNLEIVLPTIGNLDYMIENPAQPLFKAVINDSPIHLEGEMSPFSSTQEMQLNLNLNNIDLPFYLGYIPMSLPVELRNGKLNLDLNILYRVSTEGGGELELSGKSSLTSLDIWDKLHEKLFFLPLLQIEIAPSQPLKQQVHLSAVRAYNLEVHLNRDQSGAWNHARMATADTEQSASEEAAAEKETSPFKLKIDTIEIRDGVLIFADHLPIGGFSSVAREINIDASSFSLDAEKDIPLRLSLKTDREEVLSINGHFLLNPFTLSLHAELNNLDMGAYEPYYHETYSGPLGGRLGLQTRLSMSPEQPLLISDGTISWQDAYMAFNEQEGLGVAQIDISGILFDLGRNRLEVESALYEGGKVNFSRDREGHWSFLSRNFPILTKLTESPEEGTAPQVAEKESDFSYHIGELSIRNWDFAILDELPTTPARLEASGFNLTFNNLAAPEKVISPFSFSTTFQRKGRVKINGTASLADQSARFESNLKRIPLSSFAPYVAEQANLLLTDGYLDARLKTTINASSEPFDLTYSGDIGINRFHLLDSLQREDLLSWDSLQVGGINGQAQPFNLGIESITLSDYFAKFIIDEEANLNLITALSKEDKAETPDEARTEGTDTPDQETVPGKGQVETSETPDISISTITLQGGRVDFSDRSLLRPFHADMRQLGGRIQGLNADPATRAEVDLRGQLRNQSPLVISGVINPLAENLFLDLKLHFNDIAMTPLSSYSGTYAGYLIEKGKLNLALEYSIEDDQLKASNKVFLDQFSFGEPVESEKATTLPVNLAVALLKDRDGEIHLDIPISGSLDDPQFSIAGVIWTVIKNLLVKVATSPFALLGALVGGGEEDFSNISFEYGSVHLNDTEKDKLMRMSQALNERPALEVEISGYIDPDNDAEGYRRERLAAEIRKLKYLELIEEEKLQEGTSAEDITVSAEEYPDYLWQVYLQADFPKPRNFIGMTKKLPAAEMEKMIYTNTTVSHEELMGLALGRAVTVQRFLIEHGQLAREKIFLKEPDATAEPTQETALRARAEISVRAR